MSLVSFTWNDPPTVHSISTEEEWLWSIVLVDLLRHPRFRSFFPVRTSDRVLFELTVRMDTYGSTNSTFMRATRMLRGRWPLPVSPGLKSPLRVPKFVVGVLLLDVSTSRLKERWVELL